MFKSITLFFKNRTHRNLVISTLLTLLNGSLFYHFVEGWRWLDSFYFSVISLTTVGYGDFSPQTDFGKIFTAVYILTGIGLMLGFVNAIYKHRIECRQEIKQQKLTESQNHKKSNIADERHA